MNDQFKNTSRTKMKLKIFIPSADYPCLAQRVGTVRALSGLAPIKLSYLRLRDQKSPPTPPTPPLPLLLPGFIPKAQQVVHKAPQDKKEGIFGKAF